MRRSHSCCWTTRLDATSEPCALVISTPHRLTWVGLEQREFGSRKQAYGCAQAGPTLQKFGRATEETTVCVNERRSAAAKFRFKKRCAVCKLQVSFYYASCSNDTRERGDDIVALCGPLSKNTCFSDCHNQKWREYDHECVCLFISINSWVEQIRFSSLDPRVLWGTHTHDTRADIKTHKHTYRSLTRCSKNDFEFFRNLGQFGPILDFSPLFWPQWCVKHKQRPKCVHLICEAPRNLQRRKQTFLKLFQNLAAFGTIFAKLAKMRADRHIFNTGCNFENSKNWRTFMMYV